MSDSSSGSGGIGFFGALTVLFVGLKLGGVIRWSWLWVLSPTWIPIVAFLAVIGVALAVLSIKHSRGKSARKEIR